MNRRIYRKSVAPHNQRVATDIGIPTDRVDKFIELMNFYEARKDTIKLLYNPHLTGNKIRTSGNLKFVSKGYSANSVQRELGVELVTNGDFSNGSTGWNLGTGWSIVDSKLKITNSSSFAYQNVVSYKLNTTYKVTYTISNYVNGQVRVAPTNTGLGIIRNANGTYTEYINNSGAGGTELFIYCSINSTLEIDNISVREVLSNDLTQTTSTSQPYISGNIAPTETLGIKNPNGGSNYLTHPTISFGANDTWSVTTVFTHFNTKTDYSIIIPNIANWVLAINSIGGIYYRDSGGLSNFTNTNVLKYFGKQLIVTITHSISNVLSCYVNGVFTGIYSAAKSDSVVFSQLISQDINRGTNGQIKHHVITSHAPTAQEVAQEHALLRSIYPDIENVRIGEQTWATSNCEMAATPMGNVIPEMVANGNTELITNNGGFETDTVWNKDSGWSISGGTANYDGTGTATSAIYINGGLSVGKLYKGTITITSVSNCGVYFLYSETQINLTSIGTHIVYFKASSNTARGLRVTNSTGTISIDNVSIQEIGWSGSQELYDDIFNQRKAAGDTDEQATYAAVKAAAMWCHYGGSGAAALDNGAIYGKLYNWFAVKLLQMDIDYYNAANPNAMWGWRVPTQADFQQLSTYLGGNAVSGGKLKKEGTTYWNSPNTGADNSSGFSCLPNGLRGNDGAFTTINAYASLTVSDNPRVILEIPYNGTNVPFITRDNIRGTSLRLIKVTQEQL